MSCVYRVALVAFRALVSFLACMLGGCRARVCMFFVLFLFVVSCSVGLVACLCLLCLSVFSFSSFSLLLLFCFCLSALPQHLTLNEESNSPE